MPSVNYGVPIVRVFINVEQESWGDGPPEGHPLRSRGLLPALCTCRDQLQGREKRSSSETIVFVLGLWFLTTRSLQNKPEGQEDVQGLPTLSSFSFFPKDK